MPELPTNEELLELPRPRREQDHACAEYRRMNRRSFLRRSAAAAAAVPVCLPQVALAKGSGQQRDVIVTVFLRGGMDALTACVPHGDDDLYIHRPTLAIPKPGQPGGAIDLDGFFGLSPSTAPLLTPYNDGRLLIVHASGCTDPSRSHFESQHVMDSATPLQPNSNLLTGWLGRHIANVAPGSAAAPLRGIGLNAILSETLRGGPKTLPIYNPLAFEFPGNPGTEPRRKLAISTMYQHAQATLSASAETSLASLDMLASVDFAGHIPANGADYPRTEFGNQLGFTAALIKADVGIEAAHLDLEGWDHHSAMGPHDGALAARLLELSEGLEAFYLDMRDDIDRVVLVVMTEFGRRIKENDSGGTDHGHGGCMLVMGGHIDGGQVLTSPWPGIDASMGSGDMAITIDYRDILWEILEQRCEASAHDEIFPGHTPTHHGIVI